MSSLWMLKGVSATTKWQYTLSYPRDDVLKGEYLGGIGPMSLLKSDFFLLNDVK